MVEVPGTGIEPRTPQNFRRAAVAEGEVGMCELGRIVPCNSRETKSFCRALHWTSLKLVSRQVGSARCADCGRRSAASLPKRLRYSKLGPKERGPFLKRSSGFKLTSLLPISKPTERNR